MTTDDTTTTRIDGRRAGVWRTVLGCEWRLLRADAGWWLALLLLLGCMAYALVGGSQRLARDADAVAAARDDEGKRVAALKAQLAGLERSGQPYRGESFRDPGNPLSVGRGAAAPVVALAPAALGALAVGVSDLYPPSLRVAVGSRDRFLFVDEIANPTMLATGSFDVAFVIVYLYPLLLLAMGYSVLSAEREQGTLALTQASSAPLGSVLLAKLALRGGGLAAALLLAVAAWALWWGRVPWSAEALRAGAALVAGVLVYGAFWLAGALWVNSWRRDSAFNAVVLIGAWLVLLLVLPAAINGMAQVLHPAPARAEMVLAVRQAAVDVDRDRAAEQARFAQEHGAAPPGGAGSNRALRLLLAADQRADAVLERHEALVQAQRRFSDWLAWLSPPMLVNDLLAEIAGNGHTRWDAHLAQVAAFHKRWQAFFVGKAERGERLASPALAALPQMPAGALPAGSAAAVWRGASALAWVAALAALLLLLARRRLARAS